MAVKGHKESTAPLLITNLGNHNMILGLPWLRMHGVVIDFAANRMMFKPNHCQHKGALKGGQSVPISLFKDLPPDPPLLLPPPSAIPPTAPKKDAPPKPKRLVSKPQPPPTTGAWMPIQSSHEGPVAPSLPSDTVDIKEVSAYGFMADHKNRRYSSISMKQIHEQLAWYERNPGQEEITINAVNEAPPAHSVEDLRERVPGQYWDHLGVFQHKKIETLPEHGRYDHKIELEDDAKFSDIGHCPLYAMSPHKLRKVKEYLEENLNRGFIIPSTADFASPILFAEKKDGSLRFCVDYRKLNKITKKNRYPIPLILEIMAQLRGKRYLTRFDIVAAFNNLRMAEGSREATTFKTHFGTYQYEVMPFGLTGGPSSWQRYMNEILFRYLNRFCVVYLDDILIYSDTLEEHHKHVRAVLQELQAAGLQVDIDKTEFHVSETRFLGVIVGINGLRMDPQKIDAIVQWPVPKTLKQVQSFIGFCNFYRRFIAEFAKIVGPLTALSKKDKLFLWDEACQQAFDTLKARVSSAPILAHFDSSKEAVLEVDSSDFVTGGILSQVGDDGLLHPVAFFSKRMIAAECNYEIYDKELLAIIRCLEEWRPELEFTSIPLQIFSDHRGLEWFETKRQLTRRQARWAEKLSEFNFRIVYRPGKDNNKADALTRQSSAAPTDPDDARLRHQQQILLPKERMGPQVNVTDAREDTIHDHIREVVRTDQSAQDVITAIAAGAPDVRTPAGKLKLGNAIHEHGLVLIGGKIWVPPPSVVEVIREVHDQQSTGHPGRAKTFEHVRKVFYWRGMTADINRYINNCHACRRAKAPRDKKFGLLEPLPVPEQRWKDIAIDFIVELPESEGCNAILSVTDRLTKMRHFIPCRAGQRGTSAEETAKLMYRHVYKLHGLPDTIVSDRGTQFVSAFWVAYCKILSIKRKLSTAYHPETDGQSERSNQWLEEYLRLFISYDQKDWVPWLPCAEFSHNAAESATTRMSPFFANYGYEPRMSFSFDHNLESTDQQQARAHRSAEDVSRRLQRILERARSNIKDSLERQAVAANRYRQHVVFHENDRVWVSGKNLRSDRPSKKLDDKMYGPFIITAKRGSSCELQLPPGMHCWPVFHVSMLRKDPNNPLDGQRNPEPPPIIVDDNEEWEVEYVIGSRIYRRNLEYRVKWVDFETDPGYYPAEFFTHAQEAVEDFHRQHPDAAGPATPVPPQDNPEEQAPLATAPDFERLHEHAEAEAQHPQEESRQQQPTGPDNANTPAAPAPIARTPAAVPVDTGQRRSQRRRRSVNYRE